MLATSMVRIHQRARSLLPRNSQNNIYRRLLPLPLFHKHTHHLVPIGGHRYFSSLDAQTMQFPSKEAIISYLQQHPMSKDPYLTEKKIIEAVATVFAGKENVADGVDYGVMVTMHDEGKRLGLPDLAMMMIGMNLSRALKDCANNKPIASC